MALPASRGGTRLPFLRHTDPQVSEDRGHWERRGPRRSSAHRAGPAWTVGLACPVPLSTKVLAPRHCAATCVRNRQPGHAHRKGTLALALGEAGLGAPLPERPWVCKGLQKEGPRPCAHWPGHPPPGTEVGGPGPPVRGAWARRAQPVGPSCHRALPFRLPWPQPSLAAEDGRALRTAQTGQRRRGGFVLLVLKPQI